PWERKRKQKVVIDLKFPCDIRKASRRDRISDAADYKKIAKTAITFVEKSQFNLIETLAARLSDHLLNNFALSEFDLSVSKPGAVRGAQNVGVNIHRVFPDRFLEDTVFLSLGSNINPVQNLWMGLVEIQNKYPIEG